MITSKMLKSCHMAALLLSLPIAAAADNHDEEDELQFEEWFIFFELNDTDGDLGIHAKLDGDEWQRLQIESPDERDLLRMKIRGGLQQQGLTELFFESAEPTFDELDPAEFFERFPEGTYEAEGLTLDGEEIEGEWDLSHVIPARPEPTVTGSVSGAFPYDMDCDDDDFSEFADGEDVVISWNPVTQSHPTLGVAGAINVVNYEVVVEIDETPFRASVMLPPEATSYQVPGEILDLGSEIKYEVLVRIDNYNQTAVESCFLYGGDV
jgi:hypothetical protein